jgi:hypothetical protein
MAIHHDPALASPGFDILREAVFRLQLQGFFFCEHDDCDVYVDSLDDLSKDHFCPAHSRQDDNGSHCCGAPVEPATFASGGQGRIATYRCTQCGQNQDPR